MSEHVMTKKILSWFEEISKVPRESRHEEKIRAWMVKWAAEHKFNAKEDAVGNILIQVPASPGYESSPVVIIQGHMDMVCEKKPESTHDFTKDPIQMVYDGEWLTANKTTLGSDNGIGLALALTLALEKGIEHPPLELLFTVDEETGLTGAKSIQPDFLKGKILLNVDSEDEGHFTVGCAGGKDTTLTLPLDFAPVPAGFRAYRLTVGELKGGHSGIDIHGERGNAIRLVARTLADISKDAEVRLAEIKGGSAHNAIPRDTWATLFIPENAGTKAVRHAAEAQKTYRVEFKNTDPDVRVDLAPTEVNAKAATPECTQKVINFIMAIPHGVASMSMEIKGLVETSNNLATVGIHEGKLKIVTSQRSAVMSRLLDLTNRIEGLARVAGGAAVSGSGYPSWPPDVSSPLLARCKEIYKKKFGKEPVVEAIHAGLECGIIGSKYPGMDMISFGPTLKNPHTPSERIHVPSIGKVWDFMVALLKSFK